MRQIKEVLRLKYEAKLKELTRKGVTLLLLWEEYRACVTPGRLTPEASQMFNLKFKSWTP